MRIGVYLGRWSLETLGGMGVYLRHLVQGAWSERGDHSLVILADRGNEASAEALGVPAETIWLDRPAWSEIEQADKRAILRARARSYRDNSVGADGAALDGTSAAYLNGLDRAVRAAHVELLYFTIPPYVRRPCVPYVLTIHDLKHVHRPEDHDRADLARRRRWGRVARGAALVYASYEHVRADIERVYRVPRGRTAVLELAPPSDLASAARAGPQRFDALATPARFVLMPAQFWPHKNHAGVIAALARLRRQFGVDVPVVCTGQTDGECSAHARAMMRLAEACGVADLFLPYGAVSRAELLELYRRCRAVLVATLYDPGSFPALEALALARPLVASRVTSIPATVGDAALLFDPARAGDLASALLRIWRDDALCAALERRGPQRVPRRTWRDVGRDWLALCETALRAGPSLRREACARSAAASERRSAADERFAPSPLRSPLLGFLRRLPAGARYAIYPLGVYSRACVEDVAPEALGAAGRRLLGFVDDSGAIAEYLGRPVASLRAVAAWPLDAILILRDTESGRLSANVELLKSEGLLRGVAVVSQPEPALRSMLAHLDTYHPACPYPDEFLANCRASERADGEPAMRGSALILTLDAEVFPYAAPDDARTYESVVDELCRRLRDAGAAATFCVQLEDSPGGMRRTPEGVIEAVLRTLGPRAVALHGVDHAMPSAGYAADWIQRGCDALRRAWGVCTSYWAPPGWTLNWRTLRALRDVPQIRVVRGVWTGVNVRQSRAVTTFRRPYRVDAHWQLPFAYVDWMFADVHGRSLPWEAIAPWHDRLARWAADGPCMVESVAHPFRLVGADWRARLALLSRTLSCYSGRGVRIHGVADALALLPPRQSLEGGAASADAPPPTIATEAPA